MNRDRAFIAILWMAFSAMAHAQTGDVAPLVPSLNGPAAPVAPATIARDERGRATVRAVRLDAPLQLDGKLTEPLYDNLPITGFVQIEPQPGRPATEKTEMWVSYDRERIYVSARCWDSDGRIVASEMRRDSNAIFQGDDIILFMFDTFHDLRNSVLFNVNPLGGRLDGQVVNERQYNGDWNPIWQVTTGRFEGGWTFEAAVPFKSLRYGPGPVWGFNAMRAKRSTNELATLTEVPPGRGQTAVQQGSLAATLVGLELPARSRPLDLKPYATASVNSDVRSRPTALSNKPDANVGLDAKYALSAGLTADLTVHTDFAQVEADEQQVNLTRFSLFFPEKREFFLENQGTFSFGGVSVGGMAAGGDAPVLFYSRRIGLNGGRMVPLRGGGRVTGRAGPYSVGVLDIETGEETFSKTQATNFAVVRLKRDILRRSSIGLLATGRTVGANGGAGNGLFGADGTFAFFQNVLINTYWARTRTDGVRGDDQSYRAQLDYTADRYTLQLERLSIGDHFDPQVGFVRRDDMRKSSALAKFSPRLKGSRHIRKLSYQGQVAYIENGRGQLESSDRAAQFAINFVNNDIFAVDVTRNYEFLPLPFAIAPGITLPVGSYRFTDVQLNYNMGQQHAQAANITFNHGAFYNGDKTTVTVARGKLKVNAHFSLEPTYSWNRVVLDEGHFTTHLAGARVTYSMTPQMFVSALMQYGTNTNTASVNARLRWEYQPGSELFVVYNEERDTLTPSFPGMLNRAFIIKLNRLFRF